MSAQPKVLWLAARLADRVHGFHVDSQILLGAAEELHRLYAENKHLHSVNAELLEALKAVMELPIHIAIGAPGEAAIVQAARAVIAKAEEKAQS